VLNEEAGAKLMVKHGMLNLEPAVLRQAPHDAYDLWSATQRSDSAEANSMWQVLARQTAAAWPTSGSKRSRGDKQVYDGRDATRDQSSEEPGRKKTRNELRAAKKQPKLGKDGARTSADPSSETKDTTTIVCYVRVPTYTCNDTCIALSGRVQRHLYFDLLGRSAGSLLASVAGIAGHQYDAVF
jgi:hypothetical protein